MPNRGRRKNNLPMLRFGAKANPTRLVARCCMQVVLTQSVVVAQCPIISGTIYATRFAQE